MKVALRFEEDMNLLKSELLKLKEQKGINLDNVIGAYYYNRQGIVVVHIFVKNGDDIVRYTRKNDDNDDYRLYQDDFWDYHSDMKDFEDTVSNSITMNVYNVKFE